MHNPIICALDTPDIPTARAIAGDVQPHVGAIKLGLEFFTAHGAAGVKQIAEAGTPIFLDLKFHDIPNTVAKAVEATAGIDCFMMTIHTSGGAEMMRRAVSAARKLESESGKPRPKIVGVTLLTSLDETDVVDIGYGRSLAEQAKRLASLAQVCGLDGVVCSPFEIEGIRAACGDDFTLVVPGIRPAGADKQDQKRVMTPKEALDAGANYLVIGRPITGADNRTNAAKAIAESLA